MNIDIINYNKVKLTSNMYDLNTNNDLILDLRCDNNVLISIANKNKGFNETEKQHLLFGKINPYEYIINKTIVNFILKDNSFIKEITFESTFDEYWVPNTTNPVKIIFSKPIKACINNIWENLIILNLSKIECDITYDFTYDLPEYSYEEEIWELTWMKFYISNFRFIE